MALPNDPIVWDAAMDPSEVLDFIMDMSGVLDEGEAIDTFTLTMSAEGAALDIAVQSGDRDPQLVEDNRAILLWFAVDAPSQQDAAFAGDGISVGVEVRIVTNATPARTRERTFALTIRQR